MHALHASRPRRPRLPDGPARLSPELVVLAGAEMAKLRSEIAALRAAVEAKPK